MNGVKLEHMCHYSVNLSLYCDCKSVVLSKPLFTGHRSQAANVSCSSDYLQTASFPQTCRKIQFLGFRELSLLLYFKELCEYKTMHLLLTTNGSYSFTSMCWDLGSNWRSGKAALLGHTS